MKKIFKRLFHRKALRTINAGIYTLDGILIRFFSKNGFLSSFYYLVLNKKFYREHRAVLLGRIQYQKSLQQAGSSFAFLRRNIHRIEKGLIMQPRRQIFAEDYIGETVECLGHAILGGRLCREEKKWAEDVLTKYFAAVGMSAEIDKAKSRFDTISSGSDNVSYVPYQHKDLPECEISYEQILSLYRRRRSVRWYTQESISMNIINKAIQASTYAPSACNRQPYRFVVINDPDDATDVAKCALGTQGFAENIRCIVAVIGDLSAYPAERDRHVIYIDASLAAMQLMLAFETLGLSTCPINWPDIEERERILSKKLRLSFYERIIMLMAIGYANPNGGIPFSQKKGVDLLVEHFN